MIYPHPTNFIFLFLKKFKNPIKIYGRNHHVEDKREGQKEVKRHAARMNQRRERASPSCDRKLSHPQPL
jgi:hypothetical protein